ncbi:hypothetical protein KFE25_013902 [Diacronema lutheri]|uniref:Uncharacterized protein n=1 Tax=Diacronema lutheri TaxID=2081491 RepID=A0A8J5X8P6_DIALT|nr:hypothetical protein KFE25_013902 [Diacronema lutheri]
MGITQSVMGVGALEKFRLDMGNTAATFYPADAHLADLHSSRQDDADAASIGSLLAQTDARASEIAQPQLQLFGVGVSG